MPPPMAQPATPRRAAHRRRLSGLLAASGPRLGRVELPGLPVAAGLIAGACLSAYNALDWAAVYARNHAGNDFHLYYGAALTARLHGPAAAYRDADLAPVLAALGGRPHEASFLNPPPLLWLAMPFTFLPFAAAYLLWSLLIVAAAVGIWGLLAPGRGATRAMWLALFLGWWPVGFALLLGQAAVLAVLAVAASSRLLAAGRPWAAGAVLALGVVKPQLWIVVPPALLVAGHWRAVTSCAIALALLGAVSLAMIGPGGAAAWWARAHETADLWFVQRTTAVHFLPAPLHLPFQALAVAAGLAAARIHRERTGIVIAAGLVAGILAAAYLNQEDLTTLGAAAWLAWPAGWPVAAAFAAVYVGGEVVNLWPALPVAAGEVLLAAALLIPRRARF